MAHDLPTPGLEFLARLEVHVDDVLDLGDTDAGHRRIINIKGGTVTGERFSGTVLPGGADWQSILADGSVAVETRYNLQADDGAIVHIRTQGLRTGPGDVMEALSRAEEVDPASYYFRASVSFETSAPQYLWMTRTVAVCSAARFPSSVVLDAYTLT